MADVLAEYISRQYWLLHGILSGVFFNQKMLGTHTMSDNQHLDQTANMPSTQAQPAVIETHTTTSPSYQNNQQPIVIERKGGRGVATGALVLSVLALGASGFLFVEGQNIFKQQENSVQNALKDAALGESDNAQSLKLALEQQEQLNKSVMALSKDQNEDHQHLANMQRSYNELLKGRVNWLVDEIEVTLNVASQQLLLSGNVPVAISALNNIEQRLKRFDQPELIPIKKAIADDLNDLKAQGGHYLDVSSTSLKVDGLEKGVASLPLLVDSTLQPAQSEAVPTANDVDFWTRTWDKTVGMLKGMVEIRKLASNDAMLLAPEQMYFVRANLRLRLLDARLALLQHNHTIYKKNLDEAKLAVMQYFDVNSPTTQEWLKTLDELSNQNLQIVSDTALSRSQTAVRNYQTQAETDKQPVSMNEIEARSDVILPALASKTDAKTADTKAASTPVAGRTDNVPVVQAASVPVAAASKVAVKESSVEQKTEVKTEPKVEPKPEPKSELKTEAASIPSTTVATTAAGLAAIPAAKALADKAMDNKTEAKSDTPKTEKKAEPEKAKQVEPKKNKETPKTKKDTVKTTEKSKSSKERERETHHSRKANTVGKYH